MIDYPWSWIWRQQSTWKASIDNRIGITMDQWFDKLTQAFHPNGRLVSWKLECDTWFTPSHLLYQFAELFILLSYLELCGQFRFVFMQICFLLSSICYCLWAAHVLCSVDCLVWNLIFSLISIYQIIAFFRKRNQTKASHRSLSIDSLSINTSYIQSVETLCERISKLDTEGSAAHRSGLNLPTESPSIWLPSQTQ